MLPSPPPSILARANLDSPTTPSPDYALRSHLRHEITQPSSSWRPICRKLDTLCPSPRSGELRPFVATFAASNLAPVPFTDGFCFPHHRFLRLPSNISSIFFALRTPIRARRISHFRLNHQRERRYQSLLDPDEGPGRCAPSLRAPAPPDPALLGQPGRRTFKKKDNCTRRRVRPGLPPRPPAIPMPIETKKYSFLRSVIF